METFDDTENSLPPPAGHTQQPHSTPGLTALLQGWWLRVETADGHRSVHQHAATVCGPGVLSICTALSRTAAQGQWIVDGQICGGINALTRWLRTQWPARRLTLIDGVAEPSDAFAVAKATEHGDSPFDVECRTLADLRVGRDVMHVETADPEAIDMLAATLVRGHVARCVGCSPDAVPEPRLDIMIRARAKCDLLLRPIETDVMSTSIDVGLGRSTNNPAHESLVFDRVTRAWHYG